MNKKGLLQMNKLVYLHELDSVRNTPEEIKRGQEAMYHEIVMNGNSVVLTYNQFTDSKAFLCSIKNEVQYKFILELFRKGYIKLSNFTLVEFEEGDNGEKIRHEIDIYTPSQYYQHALEKNIKKKQKFIFSGMELDDNETELMEIMCNALKYSNTSLFDPYKKKANVDKAKVNELIKYTKLLLAISVEELAYNPIKTETKITFDEFMSNVLENDWKGYLSNDKTFESLFEKAVAVLSMVKSALTSEQINARSNWLNKLYGFPATQEVNLAAGIVHLAYNYVLEDSISNVSKHYDNTQASKALFHDFAHRIQLFWVEHTKEGLHELHKPQNVATGEVWNTILKWEGFPEWETAVRITDEKITLLDKEKVIYEDSYKEDRKKWRKKLGKSVILHVLIAILYIIGFHIFDGVSGELEEQVKALVNLLGIELHPLLSFAVNIGIYTLLLGMFSSYIQKKIKLPDILESVDAIWNSIKDVKNIHTARKYTSYVWLKETKTDGKKK